MSKIQIELTEEEVNTLKTIIFEFTYSLDDRQDKYGNYKKDTWVDCFEFRDKFLPILNAKLHQVQGGR